MDLADRISAWLEERIEGAGAKGVVLGLSGGLDSSVTAVLCKRALGDRVLALIMPCHSDSKDEEYARLVAKKFDIETRKVDLGPIYDEFMKTLPDSQGIPAANLKPRLRMATLYYFANKENRLVVGTGNKSEIMMGYFTKHGDGGVDILPLGDLLKREVRALAKELDIPEVVLERAPSAGLWAGQTDEGEMGITYNDLDAILSVIESGDTSGLDPSVVERVRRQVAATEHKRAPIPKFKAER